MAIIPGSEYLTAGLHVMAQSLLIPVIVGLIVLLMQALLHLGGLLAEQQQRKEHRGAAVKELLDTDLVPGTLEQWERGLLFPAYMTVVRGFTHRQGENQARNRLIADNLLQEEERRLERILAKTDLIARLGPILGLMGTLIPLGPGLAALGQGDLQALAAAIIVAFDTTVAGLAAGGLAYLVSQTRRRWYRSHLEDLELLLEHLLQAGGETVAASKEKTLVSIGRG
ncbi:MAG: MotA/TolQ/ExbB proton channel family protein [Desulforudis sp.]|nr:MAG: MotA/TolQ/ExbB proton channel family protein [Desulforudis sp.]